jgi:anaerobic selenocysteine-containing dehydrogenase
VFLDLARRVKPEHARALSLASTAAVREEIARVIPMYDGIQRLQKRGDQFQYGGPHLCEGGRFATPSGRARFAVVPVPSIAVADDRLIVTTRRGKQFNSMVQERRDALTGAERDAVLISAEDAARFGLADGDHVRLTSDFGAFEGVALVAPVKPGSLQVHWPEGNPLIDRSCRSAESGIPDYNALARIEPI